jgi:hypothetical protein
MPSPPRFQPLKPSFRFLARKQVSQPLARLQVTKAGPAREFTAVNPPGDDAICSDFATGVAYLTPDPGLFDGEVLPGYGRPAGHFLSPTMA